jgi:hypothetical protein
LLRDEDQTFRKGAARLVDGRQMVMIGLVLADAACDSERNPQDIRRGL